jgi:phosphomannomutase/phosphoglucomutase
MSQHIYREYDIRGVADRDLTSDVAQAIGRGLGLMLRSDTARAPCRIAVGRDCRLSGPRIVGDLIAGFRQSGATVVDVGVGPTPMLYFAVHSLDTDGGVMVTGSHNPGDENGFKIMRGKASFFGEDIQRLRRMIEERDFGAESSGSVEQTSVEDAYVSALTEGVKLEDPSMRVVIDAGNGSAGPLALRALRTLGLDPVPLYCEMDGTFPNHHPDPTVPKNLTTLIETVRKTGARVGIAFDGDGDRLGVIDADGEPVWGDRLLALFARDVLARRKGATVIGEVKCSQSVFDDVERHGGRAVMWKTGHSLIKTKMKESGALLAGEMSGHFFFKDRYFGYDDGIYAALRLLEILSREGRTVGELLRDLPRGHSTPEIRVECPDDVKQRLVESVRDYFRGRYETTEIDGVRVRYSDGAWALVRASNTGPVIVLRFEAPTAERLAEVQAETLGVLDSARKKIEKPS